MAADDQASRRTGRIRRRTPWQLAGFFVSPFGV